MHVVIVAALLVSLCGESLAYLNHRTTLSRASFPFQASVLQCKTRGGCSRANDIAWRSTRRSAALVADTEVKPVLGRPFSGIMDDIKRRRPYYKSDWTDGLSQKSISASLFLFFTCLAPVVAFGGLTNIMTSGTMGVIEFILSCGISGMIYAMFSGQPMAFVGPTGLTLAFISALYNFTKAKGLVFLPLYCWTGIWTSAILAMFSVFNVSNLISYCTTFTDDVFNALLALNFIYEALSNLIQNFSDPLVPAATAFTSMNIALGTWFATRKVVNTGTKSRLVSKRFRQLCVDFGPTVVIVAMTLFSATPFVRAQSISYVFCSMFYVLPSSFFS